MKYEENVNHSMILESIDWFTQAVIKTRERDVSYDVMYVEMLN